jgi:hypothetical protein
VVLLLLVVLLLVLQAPLVLAELVTLALSDCLCPAAAAAAVQVLLESWSASLQQLTALAQELLLPLRPAESLVLVMMLLLMMLLVLLLVLPQRLFLQAR